MRFVLVSKPSHGRIVHFSSTTGTLGYIPNQNYNGKDGFDFKVYDGTVFSKDAKVSIKIENNDQLRKDQSQQDQQQPNKQEPSQTPTHDKKNNNDKGNGDTPPSQQSGSPTKDSGQQKSDAKVEQKAPSEPDKPTSDVGTTTIGDSQPTSKS